MSFTWTLQLVSSSLHTKPTGLTADAPITHITTDSRTVIPGCLFVAIKGDQFDGHDFIAQAIEKGAIGILTEKAIPAQDHAAIFHVQSTLNAIRKLAQIYRESFNIPFIGVVGAVGKTTTKELLSSLLEGKYQRVLKTEGSLNGFLGIPLTLLRLKPDTEIAVIEIGIDEIGAMDQHLALVQPTHLILTAIGPEHLHQLKTVEIAASEELKAFDYARDHEKPMAVNLSDEYVLRWFLSHVNTLRREKFVTYALESALPSNLTPDFVGVYHAQNATLNVRAPGVNLTLTTPIPGAHHAHNLLAATAVASFFSMSVDQLQKGLQTFKTAYGRTELYTLPNQAEVIGDYYNSNPTSVKAALDLLASRAKANQARTHAVLGDMLELGQEEEHFHRQLAPLLIQAKITNVLLYGPRMKWLADELNKLHFTQVRHFESHDALLQSLQPAIQPGDRILIKGSRGMKMEKILGPLLK